MKKVLIPIVGVGIIATLVALSPPYPSDVLPSSSLVDRNITELSKSQTICNPNWNTSLVRPAVSLTKRIKDKLLESKTDKDPAHYELDHAISLELGGSPSDERNLWLEPYSLPWRGMNLGAREKDTVENYLHRSLCKGEITLKEAQYAVLHWPLIYLDIKHLPIPPSTSDDK